MSRSPLARIAAAVALVALCASCSMMRDYATYRRILAHEREFADVEISRYDLRVDVRPGERAASVVAGVTFHNQGAQPVDHVRVLLAPDARVDAVRCGEVELPHRARLERLGGMAATSIEISGFPPIERGGEREIRFEYELAAENPTLALCIEAEHGHLLSDGVWAPTLRTPLSTIGMDRAPLTLEVRLPVPLEPAAIADFELAREDGSTRTFRATSSFPFAPFFAYGRFSRSENQGGGARVFVLDESASARARTFVLHALAELRARFEHDFGRVDLGRTQAAVVRRNGASWGAPCCILVDERNWPNETWQEPGTYELLAHEMAHTWWGACVSMHGRGGYLHEGLANWCSADATGARLGKAVAQRAWDTWLIRYARRDGPLDGTLRDVSILEPAEYRDGAYHVGAHFYRELCEQLGRERFVALLRRFADEFAFRSADLDDLRALARREHGGELDELFARWLDSKRGGDELYARGRELIEWRTSYWRARAPDPSQELRARVDAVLDDAFGRAVDAFQRADRADLASSPVAERADLARGVFDSLSSLPELQVTVIDSRGDLVFHAQGLTGSVLGHRDVRDGAPYFEIACDRQPSGWLVNFDFTSNDLGAARENYVAWRKLGELRVIVEGHEWRAIEASRP